MADPMPGRLYEQQYEAANELFDSDPEKCIEIAKYNLM